MISDPPIVTLTLNPALDVSASVDHVKPRSKLRCSAPRNEPGGGGINVSRVCARMAQPTVAVAPLGGVTGRRFGELLEAECIQYCAIDIAGETRQSVAVFDESSGEQFRFVFPGPILSAAELEECRNTTVEAASTSRVLVISGSMPPGVDGDLLQGIVSALPHTAVIIDTSGPALAKALQSGAHILKPSLKELSTVFGSVLETQLDVEHAGKALLSNSRVDALLVSMGRRGALLVTSSGTCTRFKNPEVTVQSTVGAGDSMVAGLAVGMHCNLGINDAVVFGVAAGTAAVMSPGSELCAVGDVEALRPGVEVSDC